jgi:hypothetical protein
MADFVITVECHTLGSRFEFNIPFFFKSIPNNSKMAEHRENTSAEVVSSQSVI